MTAQRSACPARAVHATLELGSGQVGSRTDEHDIPSPAEPLIARRVSVLASVGDDRAIFFLATLEPPPWAFLPGAPLPMLQVALRGVLN